jgi:hypothetical protein
MAVQERDYMTGPESAPPAAPGGRPKLLDRLNEIGERHATSIIAVSTLLIILTVLIFAKYFYDKAQIERAEQELSKAESIEQLADLKTKFGTTPVGSRIVFQLANRYYEEGRLEDARKEYQEFQTKYPQDRLSVFVARALTSLERNAKFDAEGKEARLKTHRLLSHPRQRSDAKDPRYQWGPRLSYRLSPMRSPCCMTTARRTAPRLVPIPTKSTPYRPSYCPTETITPRGQSFIFHSTAAAADRSRFRNTHSERGSIETESFVPAMENFFSRPR